jgi:hypothetical protein
LSSPAESRLPLPSSRPPLSSRMTIRDLQKIVVTHKGPYLARQTVGFSNRWPVNLLDCVSGLGRLRKWGYTGFILVRVKIVITCIM